jgi:three-Cys-motif partner protein
MLTTVGTRLKFDEIGAWSEVKLEIIDQYAVAYSTILSAQGAPRFHHVYIDGFAGAGIHKSRSTGEMVPGSPLRALSVRPPFKEFFFIDLDSARAKNLRHLSENRRDVHVYEGDCNSILLQHVFPNVQYRDYKRGLCILDPYGLHLNWEVIATAGKMETLDIFLNFPVADMNRNVFWRDPTGVDLADIARMNAFWGDNSWSSVAYTTQTTLWGYPEKESNQVIAAAFRERLRTVAGFKRVPAPMPMRNSKGATVYYLFFASQKNTAEHIVLDIFRKHGAGRS